MVVASMLLDRSLYEVVIPASIVKSWALDIVHPQISDQERSVMDDMID